MTPAHEQKIIRNLFKQLKNAPLRKFPILRGELDASNKKGVYIIYNPRGRILHVGSTPRAKGGIAQRLRNHMQGQSSFTQKHFEKEEKKGPQLRGTHMFGCLPVTDDRRRALLEAYAIGVLCPMHIGHGTKKDTEKLDQ